MPGDPHGGLTACRYCGAHNLENVSFGCVGYGLVRRPSIECLCFWCREELLQPESGSCPCDTSTAAHPAIKPSSTSYTDFRKFVDVSVPSISGHGSIAGAL